MELITDLKGLQRAHLRTSERDLATNTYVTTLDVTNIHCQSCVSYAKEVLQPIKEVVKVDVSITDHSISVEHREDVADRIGQELINAAFEVQHLKTADSGGVVVREYSAWFLAKRKWRGTRENSEARRRHIDRCDACKKIQNEMMAPASAAEATSKNWRRFVPSGCRDKQKAYFCRRIHAMSLLK